MKKLVTLAIVIIFGFGVYFAQTNTNTGTIDGTIRLEDGNVIPGVVVSLNGPNTGSKTAVSNENGYFVFGNILAGTYQLTFELEGFKKVIRKKISVSVGKTTTVDCLMECGSIKSEIQIVANLPVVDMKSATSRVNISSGDNMYQIDGMNLTDPETRTWSTAMNFGTYRSDGHNTEKYAPLMENGLKEAMETPLSTFSIDVDTASYTNARRYIKGNSLPPKDAVRIEEMINYFTYDYPEPKGKAPFSIFTELSTCPWNTKHRLVHIGLQGKKMRTKKRPGSNLVFLLDVSGSMSSRNKLPLLISSFKLLVGELTSKDRVSIVVYAGSSGLVLPPTPGNNKAEIISALERLQAGGSTAGGAGIRLAYKVAEKNLIKNGNNRVILATDGDFNVGISSTGDMVRLIEEKRQNGVFLSVLGFGSGNLKDSRMEQIADKGNGNYYYIDSIMEGKKVFVDELGGTLFAIARDVKIQVEFNPARVKAYRLIGYENRILNKEDFEDDTKDAGELGAGHSVTALYEIIPGVSGKKIAGLNELKYQHVAIRPEAYKSRELLTVNLRYKKPNGKKSKLIAKSITNRIIKFHKTSTNFRFAAAIAQFGMLLRDSKYKGKASFDNVLELAKGAKGEDMFGYRAEFSQLVQLCSLMNKNRHRD
ncbi:MAG: DUF3520 domain-containing protein [bacterium]|nr:DUF3520 domain-containing protein [bacterium]